MFEADDDQGGNTNLDELNDEQLLAANIEQRRVSVERFQLGLLVAAQQKQKWGAFSGGSTLDHD